MKCREIWSRLTEYRLASDGSVIFPLLPRIAKGAALVALLGGLSGGAVYLHNHPPPASAPGGNPWSNAGMVPGPSPFSPAPVPAPLGEAPPVHFEPVAPLPDVFERGGTTAKPLSAGVPPSLVTKSGWGEIQVRGTEFYRVYDAVTRSCDFNGENCVEAIAPVEIKLHTKSVCNPSGVCTQYIFEAKNPWDFLG